MLFSKRELCGFASNVQDHRSTRLGDRVETDEMYVVPSYDRREKPSVKVDGKIRNCDRNSVSGRECRPMVRRHGGHAIFFLNNERA